MAKIEMKGADKKFGKLFDDLNARRDEVHRLYKRVNLDRDKLWADIEDEYGFNSYSWDEEKRKLYKLTGDDENDKASAEMAKILKKVLK